MITRRSAFRCGAATTPGTYKSPCGISAAPLAHSPPPLVIILNPHNQRATGYTLANRSYGHTSRCEIFYHRANFPLTEHQELCRLQHSTQYRCAVSGDEMRSCCTHTFQAKAVATFSLLYIVITSHSQGAAGWSARLVCSLHVGCRYTVRRLRMETCFKPVSQAVLSCRLHGLQGCPASRGTSAIGSAL